MKIAIISSTSHNFIGGTEKYARMLISVLGEGNEITEFPIQRGSKEVSKLSGLVKIDERLYGWKPGDMVWGGTYSKTNMSYIYSNFDIVIINNTLPPKKWLDNKKTVLIQHFDLKAYTFLGQPFGIALGGLFANAFFGVSGTVGNPFKKASNVVFFDETTGCDVKGHVSFIPLPSSPAKEESFKRKNFLWLGRIENKQKNVSMAARISNATNELDIFGAGPSEKRLLKELDDKSNFKGYIDSEKVANLMQKYKGLIMTSNFEGFPFTIVEAFHSGLPVIALNNFSSLSFFEKSGAIKLVTNEKEIIEAMGSIDVNEMSKNALEFASSNLSYKEFSKRWKTLIKRFREDQVEGGKYEEK